MITGLRNIVLLEGQIDAQIEICTMSANYREMSTNCGARTNLQRFLKMTKDLQTTEPTGGLISRPLLRTLKLGREAALCKPSPGWSVVRFNLLLDSHPAQGHNA